MKESDNKRLLVVKQIDTVLESNCRACTVRDELNQKYGAAYSHTDGYCNRECPVGRQLQGLGKQLVRS